MFASSSPWLRWAVALLLPASPGCTEFEPPDDGVAKPFCGNAPIDAQVRSMVGISTHLEQGDAPADAARRSFEVGQWAELGIGLVRADFRWVGIEPEKGTFDFSGPDVLVDAAEAAGVSVLAILDYGNPWATSAGDTQYHPPDDPADFGDFAAAVATRYAGRIPRYEVWNEPNSGGRFWKPTDDPVGYGALLVEASNRVHQADPAALVSVGGLFYPDLLLNMPGPEFLHALYESFPDLDVDAVSTHPYRYPFTAPEVGSDAQDSLLSSSCAMREVMADFDAAASLPVWVTEMGWHTAPGALVPGVTEEEQAAWLVRSAAMTLGTGDPLYVWYTFRDSGTDPTDQEEMFGLYGYDDDPLSEPDPEPKRAALALHTFLDTVGEHQTVADRSVSLGLDAETWAYEFSEGADTVVTLLWTTGAEQVVWVPGRGTALVRELTGETGEVRARRGAWEVHLSDRPVYLVRDRL